MFRCSASFGFVVTGACVVKGDINEEAGEQCIVKLVVAGYQDRIRFQSVDVADEAQVTEFIDLAVRELGGLELLFNNECIAGAIGPSTKTSIGHRNQTFAVMVKGVFLCIKHGAKATQQTVRCGSIISTASIACRAQRQEWTSGLFIDKSGSGEYHHERGR